MVVRTPIDSGTDPFSSESASGMTLPFLPTLVVAVVLAAGSMMCEAPEPAQAPAATVASPGPHAQETEAPVAVLSRPSAFVPASAAFSRQFPMTPHPLVGAVLFDPAQWSAPPRPVASLRPGCAGARCDAALRRSEPTRIAEAYQVKPPTPTERSLAVSAGSPGAGSASDETEGRGGALPFAPVFEVLTQAGDFVGIRTAAARSEVVAMSDVVVDLFGRMR